MNIPGTLMGPKFFHYFIQNQLDTNLQMIVDTSIKDFHFPGLNYICFQFAPNLTIRLYVIEKESNLQTEKVNIHNHLYDSTIVPLVGSLFNNIYTTAPPSETDKTYNHYYLTSALCPTNTTGGIILDNRGRVDLELVSTRLLFPGTFHFQTHEEIHNVVNEPDRFLAFMVWELPTVKTNSTLFTKTNYGTTIPTDKCYQKFTQSEIIYLLQKTLFEMDMQMKGL